MTQTDLPYVSKLNQTAPSFYQPGAQRGPRVRDLFDRIAARYDLVNDLQSFGLHRYWKRRLVGMVDLPRKVWALDLCCGTGDIAFALAARGARVVGLDFSAPMLAVALRRAQVTGASNIRWVQANALEIPFADGAFGVATMGYGLRNLASFESGLREIARVLTPGGRLVVLDFAKPDNAVWRWVYFAYLKLVVPCLGRCLAGSAAAYAYILESLQHYPTATGVSELMQARGFANVQYLRLLGGIMSLHYAEKAS